MGDSFHVRAPMQALVVSVRIEVGRTVAAGQTLVILEAMKMEHIVTAEHSGIVTQVLAKPDAMVAAGDPLVLLERAEHVEAAMRTGRTRLRSDARRDSEPRGRTLPTSSMREHSSSTGRWSLPLSDGAGRSKS